MQHPLLPDVEIIQSYHYDQGQILLDIMKLYCPQGFELDPTFGRGGFYAGGRIPLPRLFFDLHPRWVGEITSEGELLPRKADVRQLPLPDRSVSSAIFDPPWMCHSKGGSKQSTMGRKYGELPTLRDVRELYREGIAELYRVLRKGGVLVVKCQDTMYGRQNFFLHVDVLHYAEASGFRAVDLFIRLVRSAPAPWNYQEQQHARKMHSYFWVFKRPERIRKPRGGAVTSLTEIAASQSKDPVVKQM